MDEQVYHEREETGEYCFSIQQVVKKILKCMVETNCNNKESRKI